MKGLDNACEAKIEATKKEMGTDKGIFIYLGGIFGQW